MEVGEYIRSKQGLIDRIIDIRNTYSERKLIGFEESNSLISDIGFKKNIVKHSKNLIDLIEVGDYVNGEQITDICNDDRISSIKSNFSEEDIENIVTKEQFESISYKVERKG